MTPFDSNTHANRNRMDVVKSGTMARFNADTHAFADLIQAVTGAAKAVAEWYRVRAVVAQLNELDDRMLADIGLKRYQISEFAAGRMKVNEPVAAPATATVAAVANDTDKGHAQPGIDTPLAA